ncbi:hypothetical protein FOCC_FOCC006279 [Frankliniella occidentalis]|nr:hypothetical protein FOCC_FOCC006279 [Frankliniella occidentalis]
MSSSTSPLTTHKRVHTELNACTICENIYLSVKSLRRHLRSHTEGKTHGCALCEKKFTRAGNLRAHLATHTGKYPFGCTLCEKKPAGHHLHHHQAPPSAQGRTLLTEPGLLSPAPRGHVVLYEAPRCCVLENLARAVYFLKKKKTKKKNMQDTFKIPCLLILGNLIENWTVFYWERLVVMEPTKLPDLAGPEGCIPRRRSEQPAKKYNNGVLNVIRHFEVVKQKNNIASLHFFFVKNCTIILIGLIYYLC